MIPLLKDQTAVITGGASGIGRATAELFAEQGAKVIILDIDKDATHDTLAALSGDQPGSAFVLDLADPTQVSKTFEEIIAINKTIDILVNVAGGSGRRWGDGPTDVCTLEGWHKTIDLNLNSAFYCSKFALQSFIKQKKGVIVTISSVLGLVGGDQDFATHAYAASKGALISLTRSIASYYAPDGIRANVICPGLIATPMSKRAQTNDRIRTRLSDLQPLSADFGAPIDVAKAALYLASSQSSFVTGTVLTVDGGWTVR